MPKYTETWDVQQVLSYLCNMAPVKKLSLKLLTFKLVMLLALVTAQRAQTLSLLSTKAMKLSQFSCTFYITQLLKQSTPSNKNTGRTILLRGYPVNRKLCVITVLKEYLLRTKSLRKSNLLLVSWQKPHDGVSPSTVGRWLKSVLALANVDTSVFTGHSTRSASTSAALMAKVSVTQIMKQAGWSNAQTFAKHYKKTIKKSKDFQSAVLELSH